MVQIKDTSGQDTQIDPRPRRQRRVIYFGSALIIFSILGVMAYPSLRDFQSSDVTISRERLRIATVHQDRFVRDISVNGRAVAAVSPTLYSSAAGTVTLTVEAGDPVHADQILAEVESPELTSRWHQESATLDSLSIDSERQSIDGRQESLRLQQIVDLAQVTASAAQRELERAQESYQKDLISKQDYERRQDELASAQVALKHAQQDAKLAQERLAFEARTSQLAVKRQQLVVDELQRQIEALTVRSPVEGIVGNLQVEQKAVVASNQALLTVVDLSALEIELEVPESYAEDLAPGMELVLSYSNQEYAAALKSISPEINNNLVSARARFTAAAPEQLKQNQRMTARIVLEAKDNALLVQRGPFLNNGQGSRAYVLEGDLAVQRPIRIGALSIGEVEILQGLQAGDRIIISDTSAFADAERVLLSN